MRGLRLSTATGGVEGRSDDTGLPEQPAAQQEAVVRGFVRHAPGVSDVERPVLVARDEQEPLAELCLERSEEVHAVVRNDRLHEDDLGWRRLALRVHSRRQALGDGALLRLLSALPASE